MKSSSDKTWPNVFCAKILIASEKMCAFVRVVWGSYESQRERETYSGRESEREFIRYKGRLGEETKTGGFFEKLDLPSAILTQTKKLTLQFQVFEATVVNNFFSFENFAFLVAMLL